MNQFPKITIKKQGQVLKGLNYFIKSVPKGRHVFRVFVIPGFKACATMILSFQDD
jgi:hypothetical protein